MEEKQVLVEFLAWVQDNFTIMDDDCFEPIGTEVGTGDAHTREQVVEEYLSTK